MRALRTRSRRDPGAVRSLGAAAAVLAAAALAGCTGGGPDEPTADAEALAVFADYAEAHDLDIVLEATVATATDRGIAAKLDDRGPFELGVHCTSPSGDARLVLDINGARFETLCDGTAQPGFPLAPPPNGEFNVDVTESGDAAGALTIVLFAPGV